MTIIRSDVLGFCSGVRQAVDLAKRAAEQAANEGVPVYTIGPLIHNRQVLDRLAAQGVRIIEQPEDATPGIAVIRAHGIPEELRTSFERSGYSLLDGTCVRVLKSQRLAREYSEAGYQLVITGDPDHGEVRAIVGSTSSPKEVVVVYDRQGTEQVPLDRPIIIFSQTTFLSSRFLELADLLQKRAEQAGTKIHIVDTTCPATRNRQRALRELCSRCDAVLIIGGKESANTKELYESARALGIEAYHINSVEELPGSISSFKTVGITAGASTPDWLIERIEAALGALKQGNRIKSKQGQ